MSTVSRCLTELVPILVQMESLSSSILRNESEAIKKVTELCNQITAERIEHLPPIGPCQSCPCPILVADILERESLVISTFGFRRAGERLALHDHPEIFGFIKCVRGSMKVRSFTQLEKVSELEIKCRYEGEQTSSTESEVIQLSPSNGDIHEIEALEDGTFFFDALFPGYHEKDCTYYKEKEKTTIPGSIAILQKLKGPPKSQKMIGFPFPKLEINQ